MKKEFKIFFAKKKRYILYKNNVFSLSVANIDKAITSDFAFFTKLDKIIADRQEFLSICKDKSFAEAGLLLGISRQRVHQKVQKLLDLQKLAQKNK